MSMYVHSSKSLTSLHNTNINSKVLPPANGKKLWRVKKMSSPIEPSNECLNNSLRISQGEKFTVQRPPLRRPKNRPGKPKDFVFVDLSPIKVEQEQQTPQQLPSPALSFEMPMDSFSDNDSSFDSKMLEEMDPIGLGISLDYNWDQTNYTTDSNPTTANSEFSEYPNPNQYQLKLFETEQVLLQQNQQIQQLQQQLNQFQQQMQPPLVHKRSKSLDLKKKNQIQFKTYTGPKKKSKRSVSESNINTAQINQIAQFDESNQINQVQQNTYNIANATNTQNFQQASSTGMEDYSVFNQLLSSGSFTPITDYSDEEEFKSQDLNLNNLNLNLDFDYNFNI